MTPHQPKMLEMRIFPRSSLSEVYPRYYSPTLSNNDGKHLREIGFIALNFTLEKILFDHQMAGNDLLTRMRVLGDAADYIATHQTEIGQSESNSILERRIKSIQASSKEEFDRADQEAETRFREGYESYNRGIGLREQLDEAAARLARIRDLRKMALHDPGASYIRVHDARKQTAGVLARLDKLSIYHTEEETAPLLAELDRAEAALREAARPPQLMRRLWWALTGTPRAFDIAEDIGRIASARATYGRKPEIITVPEKIDSTPPAIIPLHPRVPTRPTAPDYIDSLVYPEDPRFYQLKRMLIGKEGKTDWMERLAALDREIRGMQAPSSALDVQNMTELRDALQDFGRGRYLASLIRRHESYDQAYQRVLDGMGEYVGRYSGTN